MSNRFNKKPKNSPPRTVTAKEGEWGVWIAPTLWVTAMKGSRPAPWFRLWQRVFLGWRWTRKGDGVTPLAK